MREPYGGIGFVHVLAARAGGAISVETNFQLERFTVHRVRRQPQR